MDAPAVAVSATGKEIGIAWSDMGNQAGNWDAFWNLGGSKVLDMTSDRGGRQGHAALIHDGEKFVGLYVSEQGRNSAVFLVDSDSGESTKLSPDGQSAGFPAMASMGGLTIATYETASGNVPIHLIED